MISTSEAAVRLSVSRSRVLALIKNGQLKAQKTSSVWLVDENSVDERLRNVKRKGGRPARGEGRNETRFMLMNRTHEVAEVVYDKRQREFTHVGETIDADRTPIGLARGPRQIPLREFNGWWRNRGIPETRQGLSHVLRQAGVDAPEELLQRNLGLSLSDQYWIRPDSSELDWEAVNFFDNDFEAVGARTLPFIADGERAHAHPDNTSDGNLFKQWIVHDEVRMLKKGGLHNNQEPYNEVVATALHRRLLNGDDYVPYTLDGKGASAFSLCPNFLTSEEEYIPATYVMKAFSPEAYENAFDHYLACCERLGVDGARSAIERMIVCDDILANADRHFRNFGIVRNVETLECRPAPIFDSGSSLWCDLDFETLTSGVFSFTSKQFESSPARQMLLVEDMSWFDIGRMNGFVDESLDVLSQNDMLRARLPHIRKALDLRVKRMLDIAEWS